MHEPTLGREPPSVPPGPVQPPESLVKRRATRHAEPMPQTLRSAALPRLTSAAIAAILALALLLAPSLVPTASAAARPVVTGTLVSPQGAVRSNVPVELIDAKGDSLASTRTAKDGTFRLAQPAAGTTFYLYVPSSRKNTPNVWIGSRGAQAWDLRTAPTPYTARASTTIASGTHPLRPGAGFAVTVDRSLPASSVRVDVLRLDGKNIWEGTLADADLREGFLPGRYLVTAWTDDLAAAPVEVAVSSGDVAPVALKLAARSTPAISGTVTLDGKPSARRTVTATRVPTSWRDEYQPTSASVRTDAAGRFSLAAPRPGTYTVTASVGAAVRGESRTVVVADGATEVRADLAIERRRDLGKVSGRFTVKGKQARGEVTLVRGREVRYTAKLSKGRYVLRGVVPGTYHLTYVDEKANRYYTTRVTVKASQHRALTTKKVTRKTVTVAGKHQSRWLPNLASAQQGPVDVVRTSAGRYKAAHVVPASLRIEVGPRDDRSDWSDQVAYTPRVYAKVKVTRSRTINLKDGGQGGTVTAQLRYATSGLPVHTSYVFMACQGVTCTSETSNRRSPDARPRVTGLQSAAYSMVLWEARQDDGLRWDEAEPWKNPYFLEPVTTQVRAVKGKTVSLGTIDVKVRGTL